MEESRDYIPCQPQTWSVPITACPHPFRLSMRDASWRVRFVGLLVPC